MTYKFMELPEDVRTKIKNRCMEYDEVDFSCEIYQFTVDVSDYGYDTVEKDVRIGDPFSQGGGASFKAGVDPVTFIRKMGLKDEFPYILGYYEETYPTTLEIYFNSYTHYVHEETMHVDYDDLARDYPAQLDELEENGDYFVECWEEQSEKLSELILDKAKELASKLFYHYRDELVYRSSDEYFTELFCDQRFDEDGNSV